MSDFFTSLVVLNLRRIVAQAMREMLAEGRTIGEWICGNPESYLV